MIEEYHFGSITIDGKTYNHDVEVHSDGQVLKWWRKKSHLIEVEDIKRAIAKNPAVIVIGTGEAGVAQVSEEVKKFIKEKGIELIIDVTQQAINVFNLRKKETQEKIIGLFHLTC